MQDELNTRKIEKIKIGTRKSRLALIQANIVAEKLALPYEIIPIITSGDKEVSKPLYDIGGKALFIKELEEALIDRRIDIAVHSLKDMPGKLPDGFVIAAMLEREDARDALVSKIAGDIQSLPQDAIIGTSSPRRIAYIKKLRPDIKIINLRGNVDTRVTKVLSGDLDGTILSYAGLKRLGLAPSDFCHPIDFSTIIPAVGQGVIAIEALEERENICNQINYKLNHKPTSDLISLERSYLEHMDADCKTPLGAYAYSDGDEISAAFMFASDISQDIKCLTEKCKVAEAYKLGKNIAKRMKE